jgi:purine nucleosidase
VTRPLILDVDTGIDDSLAILYACASPDVELLGITCVAGNAPLDDVVANTITVLEVAGRGDVPVFAGAAAPLLKRLETTPETHGPQGIGYAERAPTRRMAEPTPAHDFLVETIAARRGKLILVTLGPLTNVALALERDADMLSRVDSFALMGGAYRTAGNTTPTSEWNMHVDPDAARAVLTSLAVRQGPDAAPLPLAMGLDVTEKARILPRDLARLIERAGGVAEGSADDRLTLEGSAAGNPVLRFVVDALRFYFEFHARYDGFYGAFIHDPFAVAAALDRSLVTTEAVFVDVEAGPGLAHAMTVADWRGLLHGAPNLDVALSGDADRFLDELIERVGTLAAARSSVAR